LWLKIHKNRCITQKAAERCLWATQVRLNCSQ
jgi:hypothetical protein